jgi:sulfoxide reductase heme-binding subunit YedZ
MPVWICVAIFKHQADCVMNWRLRLPSWVKPAIWLLALAPLGSLIWALLNNDLGANPGEALIRNTGEWTLRMLCLVLAVTPLRRVFNAPSVVTVRRLLGLFVFFYATVHLLSYSALDMGLDVMAIAADIWKRPFITVGISAWMLLVALAVTSPKRVLKRMGAKRWLLLHKAVYVVAGLAVLHFLWMRSGKQDFADVWLYGIVLAALLLSRLVPKKGIGNWLLAVRGRP